MKRWFRIIAKKQEKIPDSARKEVKTWKWDGSYIIK